MLFRSVSVSNSDATLIFEPETLRFRFVNEGAMRQLGYSREELLTLTVVDINPEFEARFRALLAPLLRGEARVHRFTTRHRHKDGHDIPVEVNLQYVARQGKSSCFICIARDITERLKNERLALRSQRLESLGTLAGGVAHDLNNALAPILMSVELLRMQYPDESQILGTIQASAKRGADMVRQLLTFAKGAEGERVSIQPVHLIKEMLGIMKGTFPKNIRLEFNYDKKLPTVLGDATQLHQVLLNLCVNARDAMPHGGTLTLEAESREVDAVYASSVPDAKPGKYVVLGTRHRYRHPAGNLRPDFRPVLHDEKSRQRHWLGPVHRHGHCERPWRIRAGLFPTRNWLDVRRLPACRSYGR